LYDERQNYIGRFYVLANAQYIEYYGQVKVNNANARYIAFSWRTYDDCEAHLYTDTTKTLFKLADDFINWNNVFKARVNDNVKGINHRGFNTVAPENTIPAFRLSKKNGFGIVETDVYFTSDGVAVCLHDGTINRTARNADGTTLSSTINIADITYEQALTYDFGIWKGEEYAGTKIPTFEQFLTLCKNIGLNAYVELKAGTEIQIQSLVGMVNDCGMTNYVSWISFSTTYLGYIKAVDNKARLGVITSPLAQNIIADINNLKTTENEVFVDQNNGNITDEIVQMCKDNELPLEVWTINTIDILNTIDPYVTGVTSDSLVAGYELFRINI
jgi:glycerophosphoryl diester phosphodiesterase